jgi:acetyl esterase/lipase
MAKDLARRGYVVASPSYRLFSGDLVRDKFLQTVVAAYVDINEFMCFMKNKVDNGNPYRLDTEKVFMGGSSAGALMPLNFTAFVNDTSILQPELKEPLENSS